MERRYNVHYEEYMTRVLNFMSVRYDVNVLVILPAMLDGEIEHFDIYLDVLEWVTEHDSDSLATTWVFIVSCLNSYGMGT